jgi:hypothetical protein
MEHGHPREANIFSDTQEIPRILRKLDVHYGIHNSWPLVSISEQITLGYALPINICKIRFNITLSPTPTPSKRSLSFKFPHQNPVCISLLIISNLLI